MSNQPKIVAMIWDPGTEKYLGSGCSEAKFAPKIWAKEGFAKNSIAHGEGYHKDRNDLQIHKFKLERIQDNE